MTAARTAIYEIPATSAEAATRVADALAVEANDGPAGTQVGVQARDELVVITVEAHDTRGLRNASSSILRLAQVATDVDAAQAL